MQIGILCGFLAALFNSFGYLLSARFLLHYKEEARLLIYAMIGMSIVSLPFTFFVFPFSGMQNFSLFIGKLLLWILMFMLGQGCFFISLRYFEASRISSLLGLKIIVLAAIFIMLSHGTLSLLQWIAIFISALSAMLFNWSSAKKQNNFGWIFLFATLICYSLCDILENSMVEHVRNCGYSDLRSAFATVFLIYPALGICALPGLLKYKPSRDQFALALPYSLLWVLSQLALLFCYAKVQPVFGNVILATRGIFSVVLGVILASMGNTALDSKVSRSKWIQRILAALLMVAAIGIYSWGTLKSN